MGRPQGETGVNVILPTSEPDETIGMLKKTSKQASRMTRVLLADLILDPRMRRTMTCLTVLRRDVSKLSGPTKTFNDTLTSGAINSNLMKSRSTTKLDANGPSIAHL